MEVNTPELYDDLAVAYDKIGKHEKAIETSRRCEELFPGRYETAANLGTFYIHAGDFENGLEYIAIALEINPEAHFGREQYQKFLVEYVLAKRADGLLQFPLEPTYPEEEYYSYQPRGFAKFCCEQMSVDPKSSDGEQLLLDALEGVQGMMKFGHYDSPVLLEALGDLLLTGHRDDDAKRLAARAFLRASESSTTSEASKKYKEIAAKALEIHVAHDAVGLPPLLSVEELQDRLASEVRDANHWYDQLVENEKAWIASGKDVDTEFHRVYYNASRPVTSSPKPWTYGQILLGRFGLFVGVLLGIVCLGAILLHKLRVRIVPSQ